MHATGTATAAAAPRDLRTRKPLTQYVSGGRGCGQQGLARLRPRGAEICPLPCEAHAASAAGGPGSAAHLSQHRPPRHPRPSPGAPALGRLLPGSGPLHLRLHLLGPLSAANACANFRPLIKCHLLQGCPQLSGPGWGLGECHGFLGLPCNKPQKLSLSQLWRPGARHRGIRGVSSLWKL